MNLKCFFGIHNWKLLDTTQVWKKFCEKHAIECYHRISWENCSDDRFCPRCGKEDLSNLEANKKCAVEYKCIYILNDDGTVTARNRWIE